MRQPQKEVEDEEVGRQVLPVKELHFRFFSLFGPNKTYWVRHKISSVCMCERLYF